MIPQPDQDGMVSLTPNVKVPHRRAIEWMQGFRPLPGADADDYFQSSVATGLITRDEAHELHRRHEHLTRQEAASDNAAFVCKTCNGEPPPGFACRTCGTGS